MKNRIKQITGLAIVLSLIMVGCGSNGESSNQSPGKASSTESGLTEFEQEHGIGPVKDVITIGEIDMEMVEKGKELFRTKCSACHKTSERYIGPALGDVLERRSPSFVMNMILNPDEMVKKHPVAKKMLAEFLSPMPNQNLEREEARAIIEFLASVEQDSTTN